MKVLPLSVITIAQAKPRAFLRMFHTVRAFMRSREYTAMTFNTPFIKASAERDGLMGGDDLPLSSLDSVARFADRNRWQLTPPY